MFSLAETRFQFEAVVDDIQPVTRKVESVVPDNSKEE